MSGYRRNRIGGWWVMNHPSVDDEYMKVLHAILLLLYFQISIIIVVFS